MSDRTDTTIFGVVIGSDSGWDQDDTMCFSFYEFEANEKFKFIPKGSLFIDYGEGKLSIYTDKDTPIWTSKNNFEFWLAFSKELSPCI